MSPPFSKTPSTARITPTPFQVSIPQEQITELQTLVKLSKIAPPTFESLQKDRRFGITSEWLTSMRDKWLNDFDWRACEARINSFPQFTATVEDISVHFLALFSEKKDAIPIVFLHGWPGSFMEFFSMMELFKEEYSPSTLPYHIIVPSLPGYAFSSGPPLDRDYNSADGSRIIDKLMKDLGFEQGYVAQGGDIGSRISRKLAVDHESCKAAHLNFCPVKRPESFSDDSLSATEKRRLERENAFVTSGLAYALEQGTRTSTIGHVLSASPISLLAWIGEKFLEWVDDPLPAETILESVTLYWFTETLPRGIFFYREVRPPSLYGWLNTDWQNYKEVKPSSGAPLPYIQKPFGFSSFPMEVKPVPRSWVETTGNLVFFRDHDKGGHFAALERPKDLKKDVEDFIAQIWPAAAA